MADSLTIDEPATGSFAAVGAGAGEATAPRRRSPRQGLPPGAPSRLPLARHVPIIAVLAFATVLYVHDLAQNGYANTFYSAAVRSMLGSFNHFFFVSFDPGGLISVDKPPLGLWLQTASAAVFGFDPLSLLAPEAACGVISVWTLYLIVRRRFGRLAGVTSALALTVYPSFAAVSRTNNVDALLILLMVLSCAAALRACDRGSLGWLLASAALLGLAFNTKSLAAFLALPGIALGYGVCAPGPLLRRAWHLLAAGALLAAVSVSWSLAVAATPASSRPYVGGSTDNSEFGLAFDYNGFGRVGGEYGGPGPAPNLFFAPTAGYVPSLLYSPTRPGPATRTPRAPRTPHAPLAPHAPRAPRAPAAQAAQGAQGAQGARAGAGAGASRGRRTPARAHAHARAHAPAVPAQSAAAAAQPQAPVTLTPSPAPDSAPVITRLKHHVVSFGQAPGPLRLIEQGLNDQGGWLLPFAAIGLLALAFTRPRRGDPRLAALIVLGGFFVVEGAVLSLSRGIVHPYYVSALGPGTAAMVGAGLPALAALARRRRRTAVLAALAATVAVQVGVLFQDGYLLWWALLLPLLAIAGAVVLFTRPRAALATMTGLLALLLVAPTAYAFTLWWRPVQSTFPAAGPQAADSYGGVGVSAEAEALDYSLAAYVLGHHPGTRFALLTESSVTAAPLILLGVHAAALGGYAGIDPAVSAGELAQLVASHQARYVLIGGAYQYLGGNQASQAAERACPEVPLRLWIGDQYTAADGLYLLDCAGQVSRLTLPGHAPAITPAQVSAAAERHF